MNRIVLLFAILAGIAALQGCAGSSNPNYPAPTTQNPAPGVSLQSIKITPATPFIGIAENRQLFATGIYNDGGSVDITLKVNWAVSASPTNSISIDSNGIATGTSLGYSVITATAGTVVGASQLIVGTNGYTSSTIAVMSVPFKTTVIDAAYVPESQATIQGVYAVQEVNLDADQFSSQLPVPQALMASIAMPSGFVPNIAVASPSASLVAVLSYTSADIQIIDASNLPQFDVLNSTIIAKFKAPVTKTATFNGITCMICAAVIDPKNNQLLMSTAEGYFSMDLKVGTFTALPFAGALPAQSFTLNPIAASPYIASSTFGQNPPAPGEVQILDLTTNAVTTLTGLGPTLPYAFPIDVATNFAALVDTGGADQTLLDMTDPQNPAFTQIPSLTACPGSNGNAVMDMATLGRTANIDPTGILPKLYLSQSSGNCFGFEVWGVNPFDLPNDQYGYGLIPETPDGNTFLNGSDPNTIASFTSVVDKKNYVVLADASQHWIAKINADAVLSFTGVGFVPTGSDVSPVLTAGQTGDPVIFLPTPPTVVTLSVSNLTFGNQGVGVSSPIFPITLTNIGVNSLNVSQVSIEGTNAGDFTETDNCTVGALLTQTKCVINIVFTPAGTGLRSATLSITDDGGASPQTIPLSGTGT